MLRYFIRLASYQIPASEKHAQQQVTQSQMYSRQSHDCGMSLTALANDQIRSAFIVFSGVLMVNLSHAEITNIKDLLLGGFPVLIAAFCYPTGNQLVWEAKSGNKYLPDIESPLLENPFNKVLLMSIGSVPFWLILLAFTQPPLPSKGQLINTALVAIFSGVFATSLFLFARNKAKKASELAAVDATQSSEVIFAMIAEIIILNASLPGVMAIGGIILVFTGLGLFISFQDARN
jgi:drug/metabolite transporter (DMT)-like permease